MPVCAITPSQVGTQTLKIADMPQPELLLSAVSEFLNSVPRAEHRIIDRYGHCAIGFGLHRTENLGYSRRLGDR